MAGCGSSSRMTMVGTALINLGGENETLSSTAYTSLVKPQIWPFNVGVLQMTATKWTKGKTHVQSVQSYCFRSLIFVNMQICDVLVAVAVVVA